MEWLQTQFGSTKNLANSHIEDNNSMRQVFKDLERDSIQINERIYSGAMDGSDIVIGALTQTFLEICHDAAPLSEAEALRIARSLLLHCNRTQSGGDTYQMIDFLYANPRLVRP
jgi:hypothetical protein